MIVERTDFVSVPVTDVERATGFYRDTLDAGVCQMVVCLDPDENAVILDHRYKPYE